MPRSGCAPPSTRRCAGTTCAPAISAARRRPATSRKPSCAGLRVRAIALMVATQRRSAVVNGIHLHRSCGRRMMTRSCRSTGTAKWTEGLSVQIIVARNLQNATRLSPLGAHRPLTGAHVVAGLEPLPRTTKEERTVAGIHQKSQGFRRRNPVPRIRRGGLLHRARLRHGPGVAHGPRLLPVGVERVADGVRRSPP